MVVTGFKTHSPKIWRLAMMELKKPQMRSRTPWPSLSPLKQVTRPSSEGYPPYTQSKGTFLSPKTEKLWEESQRIGLAKLPPVYCPHLIPFRPIIFVQFSLFIKLGSKTALTIGGGGCFPPYEDCLCKTPIKSMCMLFSC